MKFIDSFIDVTKYAKKLPTSEYLDSGKHPIIDQGQKQIAGYTDIEEGLFTDVPAIIFGDHTRVIKYIDTPFFIGADGVKVIKCLDKQANYNYLYYLLPSVRIPNTGYNRHYKWLKEAHLVEHTKEEQEKIVSVLSTIDNILNLCFTQINKLDELIKSRFVEMFGDLETNPMNWAVETIDNISILLKSGLSRKLSDEDIGIPVIRSGNIQNGAFYPADIKYWYKDDPQGANTKDYILDDGDILINFINSVSQIGKAAIFRSIGRDCIYTTNLFRMKLADNCNEYYFNWFAMSDYYFRQIQSIIQPAVNQASFTTGNFLKLNIPLPPMEKQLHFATFVKEVDKSKLAVKQSIEKLETLKKSLMQEYFG